jgi:hypothetical protein
MKNALRMDRVWFLYLVSNVSAPANKCSQKRAQGHKNLKIPVSGCVRNLLTLYLVHDCQVFGCCIASRVGRGTRLSGLLRGRPL